MKKIKFFKKSNKDRPGDPQSVDDGSADADMPTDDELARQLEAVMDDLNLPDVSRATIRKMPPAQRWDMVKSHEAQIENLDLVETSAETYLDAIRTSLQSSSDSNTAERTKALHELAINMRTKTMRFVQQFIEADGLRLLLDLLVVMDYRSRETEEHLNAVKCISALMNNVHGLKCVISYPNSMKIIAQSLHTSNIPTKTRVNEILGAICLIPEGHKQVLDALVHLKTFAGERFRFQTVLAELARDTQVSSIDIDAKTAALALINAAICAGPGREDVSFRMHIRHEFLMLGIEPIIETLKKYDSEALSRHIQIFEDVYMDDSDQLGQRYPRSKLNVQSMDPVDMAKLLSTDLSKSPGHVHLVSILRHLVMLPGDSKTWPKHVQVIDEVVQQLCVQSQTGDDPDLAPLTSINVHKLVDHYVAQSEVTAAQQERNAAVAAQEDYKARCKKAEEGHENEKIDKEALKKSLNKKVSKLAKDNGELQQGNDEMAAKLKELEAKLVRSEHQLAAALAAKPGQAPPPPYKDGAGAVPNMPATATATVAPPPPPPPLPGSNGLAPPPPPPPPMPGQAGGIPPPPPPMPGMGAGMPPMPGMPAPIHLPPRNVPKPSSQLKSFNWAKIGNQKLPTSMWLDLNEERAHPSIDHKEFEQRFSAFQRKNKARQDGAGTDSSATETLRPSEISVIDGRRAQNCTIVLMNLKMTNRKIHHAILSLDEEGVLSNDIVEQMIKYVPSPEEIAMLKELEAQVDLFSPADRFMWEMNRIPRYEQRLKAMFFMRKLRERLDFIKPRCESAKLAAQQVLQSKGLHRLLELTLALGNYMNRGARGGAYGFQIKSLLSTVDTKSSVSRDYTLLHYMIELVDTKEYFTPTRALETSLSNVSGGSKVNLVELDKEASIVRKGFKELETELNLQKTSKGPALEGDSFTDVVDDFIKANKREFVDIEQDMQAMRKQFATCLVKFSGDATTKSEPEEFFGIFEQFLGLVDRARKENETKRRKEEEEQRKQAAAASEAERIREHKKRHSKALVQPELDDLITALKSGDFVAPSPSRIANASRLRATKRSRARTSTQNERESFS